MQCYSMCDRLDRKSNKGHEGPNLGPLLLSESGGRYHDRLPPVIEKNHLQQRGNLANFCSPHLRPSSRLIHPRKQLGSAGLTNLSAFLFRPWKGRLCPKSSGHCNQPLNLDQLGPHAAPFSQPKTRHIQRARPIHEEPEGSETWHGTVSMYFARRDST